MKLTTILLTTLLLAACATAPVAPQSDDSSAEVAAFRAEPLSTDRVRLVLRNDYDGAVLYNLCSSTLERQSGGSWETVPSDEFCTMELRNLAPGREATFEKRLPAGVTRGSYRYVTSIQLPSGEMARVRTQTFTLG